MRWPRRALVFLALSWTFVVLYPDPGVLVRAVRHTLHPRIDPAAVASLAAQLPDDPQTVEAWVLARTVPYAYDWQAMGVPWYVPTTREVLAAGRGDCQSRALVLASILTAKGIPNELRMSLDHVWVDYPGKAVTQLEDPALQIAGRRDGKLFLQWPRQLDLRREAEAQVAMFWTPSPWSRRLLLAAGLTFIGLWNPLAALLGGAGLGTVRAGAGAGGPGPGAIGPPRPRAMRRRRAPGVGPSQTLKVCTPPTPVLLCTQFEPAARHYLSAARVARRERKA